MRLLVKRIFNVRHPVPAVIAYDGAALRDKYNYMAVTRGIGKGKSIVTIARKMGELLYTLLKNNQIYEPKKFILPDGRISKIAEEALGT